MPDMQDVVFAVYHAARTGELVEWTDIAASCRAKPDEVDEPLADAVDAGLLERDESPQTHRVAFRLTKQRQDG